MHDSTEYKGKKIEVTRNQFGWITIVNGRDIEYQQISKQDAIETGKSYIDSEGDNSK